MDSGAIVGYELVDIGSVETHPQNPRRGNVDAIANSLAQNGQFKPIVVNKRNNRILAGNHTYEAARRLGWKTISVAWVDVDDDQELRIMLADNRTSDIATYDDDALADMIDALSSDGGSGLFGTGFEDVDLSELLNEVDQQVEGHDAGANNGQAKVTLFVAPEDEAMLRDRLLALAYEIPSLRIR